MDSTAGHFACDVAINRRTLHKLTAAIGACIFLVGEACGAHLPSEALAELSLEELAALPVTAVSKMAIPVSDAPASVFVITERDLRRSGKTSLAEGLRLAPNLHVARANPHRYVLDSRNLLRSTGNVLVVVDGRLIYSPLHSETTWASTDLVLEDIDRVEVVAGPNGSLWGANAFNGMINILTRSSADTQGKLVSIGANQHEQHVTARYGGGFNEGGHYRVYVKHRQNNQHSTSDAGSEFWTGWDSTQTGFRTDWETDSDAFTLQGDAYTGRIGEMQGDEVDNRGANLLARVSRNFSQGSHLTLQTYVDYIHRQSTNGFAQDFTTFDMELQHLCEVGNHQTFMWGGGLRYQEDRLDTPPSYTYVPQDYTAQWYNLFVRDDITLTEQLTLTLGAKAEKNPFTGWEAMPSLQLAWSLTSSQLLWAGFARAVRTPSRFETQFRSPREPIVLGDQSFYLLAGNPHLASEVAEVLEVGYRVQPNSHVSYSLTGFYSDYAKLGTVGNTDGGIGLTFLNRGYAEIRGVEMWGSWQALSNLRLHAGVTWEEGRTGVRGIQSEPASSNKDSKYLGLIRASLDITPTVYLDSTLGRVSTPASAITTYTTFDINLGWRPLPHLELSLAGQNIFDDEHIEVYHQSPGVEFGRTFYAKLVWGL